MGYMTSNLLLYLLSAIFLLLNLSLFRTFHDHELFTNCIFFAPVFHICILYQVYFVCISTTTATTLFHHPFISDSNKYSLSIDSIGYDNSVKIYSRFDVLSVVHRKSKKIIIE